MPEQAPTRSVSLLLATLSFFAMGGCRADTNEFETYGAFFVRSTGDGQLSTGMYSMNVRTAGKLAVNYIAARAHCSSVRMHFLVDGVEKAVSGGVAPGNMTRFVDLGPVSPGNHVVALQAEGILGGCDTGKLSAWSGSVQVWTALLPGDHPSSRANDLGELIIEVSHQHYGEHPGGDGTYVTQGGLVYRYASEPDTVSWSPSPHADGEYAEVDLQEKFSHSRQLMGRVARDDYEALKRAVYAFNALSDAGAPMPSGDTKHDGNTIDQTEYRLYQRQYANGDYASRLIGDGIPAGAELRSTLDRLARGEGYRPVIQVVCVMAPCDPIVPPP